MFNYVFIICLYTVLGVNFTTVPPPDDQNTLSFCLKGDGSSGEPIRAFCSWAMGSFLILPRVNIDSRNGEHVSLSVTNDRLAMYGIEIGNASTHGEIFTLPLLITPSSAINGSAIGCSEEGISSTNITFIASKLALLFYIMFYTIYNNYSTFGSIGII